MPSFVSAHPTAIRLLPINDVRALLAIDGPAAATFNTIVEAQPAYEGALGNTITLALASGGLWVPNKGILTLTGNATRANSVGTLTLAANPTNSETVTIGATVYTFVTAATTTAFEVTIGAAATDTLDNLIAAINLGTGSGSLYGSATTLHPTVVAAAGAGDTMTATAKTAGTAGNSIATTDGMGDAGNVWGAVTLADGAVAETVTINTTVYTFVNHLTTANHVLIGASASATLDNLIAAINGAAGAGTTYGTGTAAHTTCRAYVGAGDTMDVFTNSDTILTAVGTLFPTTQTMASGTWGATTLADGTNGTNVAFSVAGTAISVVFSSGYTTVSDFEAALAAHAATAALVRVKTAGTTPLYQMVVTDDDFTATNLTGGGATAAAAPTLVTQGAPLPFLCDQAVVFTRSVAGSGTLTALVRLWGWSPSLERWYPLGTSATTTQGYLNGGVAMAEIGTIADTLRQAEGIAGLRKFSRLYAEIIGSLGGTATEIEIYVDCTRASTVTES